MFRIARLHTFVQKFELMPPAPCQCRPQKRSMGHTQKQQRRSSERNLDEYMIRGYQSCRNFSVLKEEYICKRPRRYRHYASQGSFSHVGNTRTRMLAGSLPDACNPSGRHEFQGKLSNALEQFFIAHVERQSDLRKASSTRACSSYGAVSAMARC